MLNTQTRLRPPLISPRVETRLASSRIADKLVLRDALISPSVQKCSLNGAGCTRQITGRIQRSSTTWRGPPPLDTEYSVIGRGSGRSAVSHQDRKSVV